MMRRVPVTMAAAMLLMLAACTKENGEPDPQQYLSGTVQIGVNSDLPGWSDYTNGVWLGFDIELARWLGAEIGFRPQFTPVTTDERMIRLVEVSRSTADPGSSIKLVIANFSITDERRKDIDFAGPYFTDTQGIMTLAGAGIKEMGQLHSKPVCVTFGSTTEIVIGGTPVLARPENTHRRCVQRLREGQVSAVSSDLAILEAFVNEERGLELTPIQSSRERYGIGLPNDRPRLCEFLKQKLTKFIDQAWDQKLKDALPGVSGKDRKPNSDALDTCETPDRALKPLALFNSPAGTVRRRGRARPHWR